MPRKRLPENTTSLASHAPFAALERSEIAGSGVFAGNRRSYDPYLFVRVT
jgi:hypothetical protein